MIMMISLEGVRVIVQFVPYTRGGLYFSTVKLHIPPIFVPEITIRNRPHHSKCLFDTWNVIGQNSNGSSVRPIRFTCPAQHGFFCGKRKKRTDCFLAQNFELHNGAP